MNKEDLRIVYMGTPDFAVESLKCLVDGGYNVVGVVTMPDKPMGRHGSVLQPSPVKQYAVEKGLRVLQPEKLKDPAFVDELRSLNADLQIVVAFRMLPEVVWNMPRLGTFNLHASLLPQYRGAAPINWAVINGDKETGITTFFLKHEIDTGRVIQQVKVPIEDTDNVGDVHDKLMLLGGKLVTETVDNIIAGTITAVEQDEMLAEGEVLRPAPKIFHDTCRIDWQGKTMKQIYDFIRGLSPYPAAWTELQNGDKTI
ncbi:MAG: methionyl-tRNA formyltransferase, partial [Bacteroidaceae bacterium]|nr:methionyl-tRNA formyltransferase [Bacteroidaceae bacterium]